jgi:hypothetical protein
LTLFQGQKKPKIIQTGDKKSEWSLYFWPNQNLNLMADYQKVSSISFTAETTADSSIPIITFKRSNLIDWLQNDVTSNDVAIFFRRSGAGGDDVTLVISEIDGSGVPTSEQFASAAMPCPIYCPQGK